MSKNVTLTIVLKGKAERLYRKYGTIIREAEKAYFVSSSGKIIPADAVNSIKVRELDRSA